MGYLSDEYKILQGKVDEIGGFRVTIKGWSVTATIGGLVAIASGKGFSPTVSSLAIDVLLVCFWWFERRQVHLGWSFNSRIRRIEIEIDKVKRAKGVKVPFSSPNIARALFGRKKRKDLIQHDFESVWLERLRRNINQEARLAWSSDVLFYILLIAASWLPKMMHASPKDTVIAPPVSIQNTINVPPQTTPAPAINSVGGRKKESPR